MGVWSPCLWHTHISISIQECFTKQVLLVASPKVSNLSFRHGHAAAKGLNMFAGLRPVQVRNREDQRHECRKHLGCVGSYQLMAPSEWFFQYFNFKLQGLGDSHCLYVKTVKNTGPIQRRGANGAFRCFNPAKSQFRCFAFISRGRLEALWPQCLIGVPFQQKVPFHRKYNTTNTTLFIQGINQNRPIDIQESLSEGHFVLGDLFPNHDWRGRHGFLNLFGYLASHAAAVLKEPNTCMIHV